MMDGTYADEHGNKFHLKNNKWIVECCAEPRGFVGAVCDSCGNEVQPDTQQEIHLANQPTNQND